MMLNVPRDTVRKWRTRYDSFPEATHGSVTFPFYSRDEITNWYIRQWPEKASTWPVTLHRFYVSPEHRENKSVEFGPMAEARGYLKAIRDLQYRDWQTWHSSDGLVAERGNDVHVWYLDSLNGEPQEWFVYQGRIKGGSNNH